MTKPDKTEPDILDLHEVKSSSGSGHMFPLVFILTVLALAGWNFRQEIIGFLEQQPSVVKTTVDGSSLGNKLLFITNKVDALALRVDALEQEKNAKIEEDSSAKTTLPAPSATNAARLETEVAALTQAIGALQEQIKQTNETVNAGQKGALLSLVTSLDILSQTGRSFLPEYNFLHQATARNAAASEVLVRLEPFAATGVPGLESLKKEFVQKSSSANAAILKSTASTWYERLWIEAQQLVTIRTLHTQGSQSASMALIAEDLEQKKLGDALEKAKNLPEAGRAQLADWIKQAESRVLLETTLADLARLLSE